MRGAGVKQTVEVGFTVLGIDTGDLDVARVGVLRLEVYADSPLLGIC
jgi:hypothetical protein